MAKQIQINPNLLKRFKDAPPRPTGSNVSYLLDSDNNAGINALYVQLGGNMPKSRIVNDILRAALFSDALDSILAVEAAP